MRMVKFKEFIMETKNNVSQMERRKQHSGRTMGDGEVIAKNFAEFGKAQKGQEDFAVTECVRKLYADFMNEMKDRGVETRPEVGDNSDIETNDNIVDRHIMLTYRFMNKDVRNRVLTTIFRSLRDGKIVEQRVYGVSKEYRVSKMSDDIFIDKLLGLIYN